MWGADTGFDGVASCWGRPNGAGVRSGAKRRAKERTARRSPPPPPALLPVWGKARGGGGVRCAHTYKVADSDVKCGRQGLAGQAPTAPREARGGAWRGRGSAGGGGGPWKACRPSGHARPLHAAARIGTAKTSKIRVFTVLFRDPLENGEKRWYPALLYYTTLSRLRRVSNPSRVTHSGARGWRVDTWTWLGGGSSLSAAGQVLQPLLIKITRSSNLQLPFPDSPFQDHRAAPRSVQKTGKEKGGAGVHSTHRGARFAKGCNPMPPAAFGTCKSASAGTQAGESANEICIEIFICFCCVVGASGLQKKRRVSRFRFFNVF